MRYLMRRNLMSMDRPYTVRDEMGRETYRAEPGTNGHSGRLTFCDPRGRELASVRRAVLSNGSGGGPVAYEIYYADDLHAVIRPDGFNPCRCSFSVDSPGPDDLQAYGDLPAHEYAFSREGRTVATVSAAWFRPGESYGVDVGRGEDEVLILAGAVVIDACAADGLRAVRPAEKRKPFPSPSLARVAAR